MVTSKNVKTSKGFTLVELIIVLAVLGIIAAIVVPRFAKAQNDTKKKADIATAKGLAKAAEMYITQNDSFSLPNSGTKGISISALEADGFVDDVTPELQYYKDTYKVTVDSTGKITVTAKDTDDSTKTLYPQ